VLSRILRYAVDAELLVKKPKMELFKVGDADLDFLDFDEYQRLHEANREEADLHAAILLGGDAGLRRGEILGLEQSDVDQRNRRISVKRAVWNNIVTLPKSGRGRTLPMTDRLAAALASLRFRHLRGSRSSAEAMAARGPGRSSARP
jgi:integrase